MPIVRFQVGQRVKVVSRGNSQNGQIGLIRKVTVRGEEVIYNLDFKGLLWTKQRVCFQTELRLAD